MIFRHPVVVEIEKEAIMPGDPTRMEEKSTANVRRNPVIYRCPTPDPAQALIFGGGATGGTVHMPDDSLYLLISRSDLWNEKAGMGAIAAVRLRGSPGLFTSQNDIRQECDLSQAKLWFRIETSDGEVRIRLTCLRGRDVVSLEIEDDRSSPGSWSLAIENWHEGEAVTRVDDSLLETTHVNLSSCFAEHNQAVGVNASVLGLSDPLLGRAWGLWVYGPASARSDGAGIMTLPPAHCQRALVATACDAPVSGKDVQDIVSARGRALARTPADTLEAWHIDHRQWWQRFWESSFIRLQSLSGEAEYEERLWYANLYALACGMGGPYPMRFNGGPFLLEKDCRTWDHGYWGQNMRLVYFPMLAAGHCDFVREYIDWYLGNSDFVRDQTKSLFGVDGLAWRETQSFWGADTASSLAEPNGMMHHHFTNNLEFCLLMELYYRATGDEVFLREQFFPALRGVLEFFRRYATSGSDGLLHLQPAGAVEIWPQMIDPQSEICGLHHFLPRAIDWAGQFEENNELIGSWRDFLAHLPAVPIGRWHIESAYDQGIHDERWLTRSELREDGIYLPAAGQTRERTQRVNMENAELYIVFPWNQVNLDSPEPERRRIESTWNHRTWRYQNNGWAPQKDGFRQFLETKPRLFRDAGFAILRSGGTPETQIMATLDFGRNIAHAHLDRNQITLAAFGKMFTHGPGSSYNVGKGGIIISDDPKLKSFVQAGSLSQNVVLVDAQNQMPAIGETVAWSDKPDNQYATARVSGIAPGVEHTRTLALRDGLVIVLDRLESAEEHTYDFVYHNFGELSPGEGWTSAPAGKPLAETANYANIIGLNKLTGQGPLHLRWDLTNQVSASAKTPPPTSPVNLALWQAPVANSEIYTGTTGLNNPNTTRMPDAAPTLFTRARGKTVSFVTVLEPYKEKPSVTSIEADAENLTIMRNGKPTRISLKDFQSKK